jgi:hypothetical protein
MKGLFLDTATQIARHWHSDSEREEIKKQLNGRNLYCSVYIKRQYKSTLLVAGIGLYNLLIHFKDLRKALRESDNYKSSQIAGIRLTTNVQRLIQQVGHWMLEYRDFEEQKLRLEDLIEDEWEGQFHYRLKEPLIDETGCKYANGEPEIGASGAYNPIKVSCTKDEPQECKIKDFFDKHQIQLEILANMDIDAIKAAQKDTDELHNVKSHANEIIRGDLPHGRRCTVYLSDAIICIESTHCPEPVAVHSINKKHFRPLCEVLDIECEPKE